MKKGIFIGALISAVGILTINAQSIDDIVRYSQTNSGGTALSLGMGGATGAVGGDFSNALSNPGGLAMYRQSEFGGSAAVFNNSTNSNFYGTSEDDRKYNFNIQNMHLVLNYPTANRLKTKGWLSSTLAFGYNKTSNLSEQWTFRGFNPNSSIVDAISASSSGLPNNLAGSDQYTAYQTYLTDTLVGSDGSVNYTSFLGPLGGNVTQRGTYESRGRVGETSVSYAGNYSNRLYIGAGLSLRRIIFEKEFTYTERDDADSSETFNSLTAKSTQSDRATAIALRGGAVYRVNDFVRLGASALIPLDYTVNTDYSYSMSSDLSQGTYFNQLDGTFKYKIRTPARYTGSIAVIIAKRGIISADYEAVDYSRSKLVDNSGVFDNTNDAIKSRLQTTGNIRVGGEMRFDDMYLRGGFQLLGDPYSSSTNNQQVQIYSIGGGYRNNLMFFDIAYNYSSQQKNYYPYSPNLTSIEPAILSLKRHQLVFSIGSRF
jgi:hypothetical protein